MSATEGIVFSVGENKLGGQVVWVSRFADIGRGDYLRPGDIVGYVGNTGNAIGTSCHLHYGIYRKGNALTPYPLLISQ